MTGATLIEAQEIGFRADGHEILESIDLAVGSREIVTLIGPNGSGKTTLARILLGLLKPTAGAVRRREGLRVGYVPQRLHVEDVLPIKVRRFVALAGNVDAERVSASLHEVRAESLAEKPLQRLSPGELQRVLLARAIARKPEMLVLDEPAQGVDILGQDDLYHLIADLKDQYGASVLMISHDLHFVMAASDRVVCLNGHICCSGKPDAVSRDPAYIELFGENALAIAPYTHDHNHHHHPDGTVHPGHDHELDEDGNGSSS